MQCLALERSQSPPVSELTNELSFFTTRNPSSSVISSHHAHQSVTYGRSEQEQSDRGQRVSVVGGDPVLSITIRWIDLLLLYCFVVL